MSTFTMKDPPP